MKSLSYETLEMTDTPCQDYVLICHLKPFSAVTVWLTASFA